MHLWTNHSSDIAEDAYKENNKNYTIYKLSNI